MNPSYIPAHRALDRGALTSHIDLTAYPRVHDIN